jgi:hypothetical protein
LVFETLQVLATKISFRSTSAVPSNVARASTVVDRLSSGRPFEYVR